MPGPLRELSGNRGTVRVDGTAGSVSEALSLLWSECPAVRDRVITELGEVRPHVNIFVDGESFRDRGGLGAPVPDGAGEHPPQSGPDGRHAGRLPPSARILTVVSERAPLRCLKRAKVESSGVGSPLSGMLWVGLTTAVLLMLPVVSGAIMLSVIVTVLALGCVPGPKPLTVRPVQSYSLCSSSP